MLNDAREDEDRMVTEEYGDVRWGELNVIKFSVLLTIAHTIENVVYYPFWVLKTRQQIERKKKERAFDVGQTFRQLREIQKIEGIKRGLYHGFVFSSIASIPSEGLYLVSYNFFKERFNHSGNQVFLGETWAPFAAGLMADISVNLIAVPSDVVVQRMQVKEYDYKGPFDACRKIFQSEGIRGFYRGLGASMICWMPSSGVWWLSYERCKRLLYPFRPFEKWSGKERHRNYYAELMAAMIATSVTTVMFNPLEIVKTRLQTQLHATPIHKHADKQLISNTFTGLVDLIREEGVRSLTKGMVPRLIARVPLAAISTFIYEVILHASKKD